MDDGDNTNNKARQSIPLLLDTLVCVLLLVLKRANNNQKPRAI